MKNKTPRTGVSQAPESNPPKSEAQGNAGEGGRLLNGKHRAISPKPTNKRLARHIKTVQKSPAQHDVETIEMREAGKKGSREIEKERRRSVRERQRWERRPGGKDSGLAKARTISSIAEPHPKKYPVVAKLLKGLSSTGT